MSVNIKVLPNLKKIFLNCLSINLFSLSANKTSKLYITGPLWGESTSDQRIPSQMASNAESVSM